MRPPAHDRFRLIPVRDGDEIQGRTKEKSDAERPRVEVAEAIVVVGEDRHERLHHAGVRRRRLGILGIAGVDELPGRAEDEVAAVRWREGDARVCEVSRARCFDAPRSTLAFATVLGARDRPGRADRGLRRFDACSSLLRSCCRSRSRESGGGSTIARALPLRSGELGRAGEAEPERGASSASTGDSVLSATDAST